MPKIAFQNFNKIVLAVHRNPCAQLKLFFTARCADGTASIDIKTTGIASVACPLLISDTFRDVLNQCAPPCSSRRDASKRIHGYLDGPSQHLT